MNLNTDDQSLSAIWEDRVKAAEVHPDGIRGYCRQERIAVSRLYYWRNKFKAIETETVVAATLGNFIVAEVAESVCDSTDMIASVSNRQQAPLPDPKWLASFATELIRGLQS